MPVQGSRVQLPAEMPTPEAQTPSSRAGSHLSCQTPESDGAPKPGEVVAVPPLGGKALGRKKLGLYQQKLQVEN